MLLFFLKIDLETKILYIIECRGPLLFTEYINFAVLESPMLHAKSQDHRTSGSGDMCLRCVGKVSNCSIKICGRS